MQVSKSSRVQEFSPCPENILEKHIGGLAARMPKYVIYNGLLRVGGCMVSMCEPYLWGWGFNSHPMCVWPEFACFPRASGDSSMAV